MKNLVATVLLTIAAGSAAAQDVPGYRITLPSNWSTTTRDDVTTWVDASGKQVLTAARYRLLDPPRDESQRRALMLQSIALRRDAEGDTVTMSPVRIRQEDGVTVMLYTGEDPVTQRRFADITLAAGEWMQHFHFEAIGIGSAALETFLTSNFSAPKSARQQASLGCAPSNHHVAPGSPPCRPKSSPPPPR